MNVNWEKVRGWSHRVFRRGKVGMESLAVSLDRQAMIHTLTTQMRGLMRQRNELLLGIGKKVYTLYVRGKVRNKDVLADCDKIDAVREQIKALQAQIDEIRSQSRGEVGDEALSDESLLAEEEGSGEEETPAVPGAVVGDGVAASPSEPAEAGEACQEEHPEEDTG